MIGAAAALWLAAAPAPAAEATPPAAEAPAAPAPAAPEARAEPSRASVQLGEPFDYAVTVRHAPGEAVELLPPPDLSPFALRGVDCRTTAGERNAATTCTLSLQLLDLGEHRVPPLRLRARGPSGEWIATAPGAAVEGLGSSGPGAADGGLRAPAPPPVMVPSWRLAAWGAGALALAAAAWLLWRAARRRRRRAPEAPFPPRERLRRRVEEILSQDLPRRGRGREHLVRLADAAREYLAAVSPGAALDLTSSELLAELARRAVPGVEPGGLGRLLAAADLVKFARADPAPEECGAAAAFARDLLEATRPAAPAAPGAAEAA